MDLQGGKSRLHTEAERGSGMANEVCSAMMLRQHHSVPSAEGDVAENGHVFVLYRLETRPRGQLHSLCRQTGLLLGRQGDVMGWDANCTAGVRERVVKAEDGL